MFTEPVESIIECKKSDIPELVEIAKSTYAQTYPGLFTPERLTEIFTVEKFEKDLTNSNCCIMVARRRGHMMGYAKVMLNVVPINSDHIPMLIDKIYVLQDIKNSGVGSRLIEACFQFALAKNIHKAKVFVFDTNFNVKGFYEKFGFQNSGEKVPYYNDGKFVGNDHVMVCDDIRKYLASTMRPKL